MTYSCRVFTVGTYKYIIWSICDTAYYQLIVTIPTTHKAILLSANNTHYLKKNVIRNVIFTWFDIITQYFLLNSIVLVFWSFCYFVISIRVGREGGLSRRAIRIFTRRTFSSVSSYSRRIFVARNKTRSGRPISRRRLGGTVRGEYENERHASTFYVDGDLCPANERENRSPKNNE